MSRKRALVEIGLVVGTLVAVVAAIVWLAGVAAEALSDSIPPEVDEAIGEQAWQAVAGPQSARCTNPEPLRYVQSVAAPLVEALGPTPFEFRFAVVESKEVNAFALPGGFVTVNMGLLEAAETGEEVAAVLGHEIQHVIGRHGTERILRQLGGTTVLYAVFGGTDIGIPAQLLSDFLHTAYDRDQERESDEHGRALLMKAGLDPSGMARFFERLAKSGMTPPELLSTHPDPGGRAEAAARAAKGFVARRKLPQPKGLKCR